MARLAKKEYNNFTGGYNDVASDYDMKDNELRIIENFNIKKTVGGLALREGVTPINPTTLNGNITRRIEYFLGLITRKVIVLDQTVYFDDAGSLQSLVAVDIEKPHFIQNRDVLYISDNTDLYEYGQKDYFSSVGTVDVVADDIVQVTDDHPNTLIHGRFYKALSNLGSTDLSTEDYTVVANWDGVTDVIGRTSAVTRPLKAFDPSAAEVFTIQVTTGATNAGTIDITANNITTGIAVAGGDSPTVVATKINAGSYTGYTTTVNQNLVTFTADANEFRTNPTVNFYDTQAEGVLTVVTNGVTDNNNIAEVRKCQRIILHSKSGRYVASGNPDDPTAVYFSEPGQINYWKNTNVLVPTSGDGAVRAMFNLVNSVVVSFNRSWWEYTGVDPEVDAEWKRLPIPFGCVSEWTISILDYTNFMYLANDGLYVVSSNILNQEGVPTQDTDAIRNVTSIKVDNTIASITDKTQCVSIFRDDVYYMAYNDDAGEPLNNKVLCYFTDFRSFTKYTGWAVNDFLLNSEGKIEFASKNFSLLTESGEYIDYDVDAGATKPIIPLTRSANLTFDKDSHRKWFEKAYIHFTQAEGSVKGTIDFTLTIGNIDKEYPEVNITPSFVWGDDWGSQWGLVELINYMIYVRRRGYWIRWEMTSNTEGLDIELYSVEFSYQAFRAFNVNYLGTPINRTDPDDELVRVIVAGSEVIVGGKELVL